MTSDNGDTAPVAPDVTQGLPPRPIPYEPTNGLMQFVPCDKVEGQDERIIALIYDSADTRTVSYWAESAFRSMVGRMTAFLDALQDAPGLHVADENDLRMLRDAGQITPGSGNRQQRRHPK